jgi:hypothetical protein
MNLFFQHLFHLSYVQFFLFSVGFQFGCENMLVTLFGLKTRGGGGDYGDVEKKDNQVFL